MSVRRIFNIGTLASAPWIFDFATRFVRTVIFAHLLSPIEFGIAIAANVLLAIAYLISDLGIDKFLISRPRGDDAAALATAHGLQLAKGLAVSVAIFVAAPVIASLFGDASTPATAQWVAAIVLVHAFVHLGLKQAARDFNYVPEIKATILSGIASLLVVYPAVLVFRDHRAMIASLLLASLVYSVASHCFADTRYGVSIRHTRILRDAATYGLPLTINGIGLAANSQLDRVLVSYWLGPTMIAAFTVILNLPSACVSLTLGILATIGVPFLAQVRDAKPPGVDGYIATVWIYGVIAAISAVITAATLDKLVPLVFGHVYEVEPFAQMLITLVVWTRLSRGAPTLLLLVGADTTRLMMANLISGSGLVLAAVVLPFLPYLDTAIACGLFGEALSLIFFVYVAKCRMPGLHHAQLKEFGLSFVPAVASAGASLFIPPHYYGMRALVFGSVITMIAVTALLGYHRYLRRGELLAILVSPSTKSE